MAQGSKLIVVGLVGLTLAAIALESTSTAGFGRRGRSVGGVMVDPSGFLRNATVEETQELHNLARVALDRPRGDLAEAADLRMVSLRGLQQAILQARREGRSLPDDVALLAGLQRVAYLFLDPDRQDVILAGPAEPWKLADDGSIVGAASGGATLRLDDLVVALRSVENARREGISCSIEPTAEGRRRLQKLLSGVQLRPGQNPALLEPAMREAFGPQQVILTGVPHDSRYALTMVAADYQMKRIAMALHDPQVPGLPSYLAMARNVRHGGGENPRWWLAGDYDAVVRTADGSAWQIRGPGVKVMTEQDLVSADGQVTESGRVSPTAARWAEKMTEHYGALSKRMPVFQELRNLMDLTLMATLIRQEGLAEKVNLDLSLLLGESDTIELASYPVPKAVAPECSFVRTRGGVIATASGGVDINAFQILRDQTSEDDAAAPLRQQALAAAQAGRWWWDHH